MHVYGRRGRFNQIAMIARGCNEKHENNLGKAFANTLEHDDQNLLKGKIVIWLSGKFGGCHPKVRVRNLQETLFSLSNFSSEIRCEFRVEPCWMLIKI